jgi:hypothetical protein
MWLCLCVCVCVLCVGQNRSNLPRRTAIRREVHAYLYALLSLKARAAHALWETHAYLYALLRPKARALPSDALGVVAPILNNFSLYIIDPGEYLEPCLFTFDPWISLYIIFHHK